MSLGDAEHPISFSFAAEIGAEHVEVTVRSGIAGSRALAGALVLKRWEWIALEALLSVGSDINRVPYFGAVIHLDDPPVVCYTIRVT